MRARSFGPSVGIGDDIGRDWVWCLWEILVRVLNVQTWILPPVSLILAELFDKPDLVPSPCLR